MADSLSDFLASDLAELRSKVPGHVPAVLDHNGFEKRFQNKVRENLRADRLHGVQLPSDWQHSPRFATRFALRETRAAGMRPHATFDIDGDGFVGQQDYAIAKKHATSGMCTPCEISTVVATRFQPSRVWRTPAATSATAVARTSGSGSICDVCIHAVLVALCVRACVCARSCREVT